MELKDEVGMVGCGRYKMEWIYSRARVSGPGNLELALRPGNEKERKKG